MIEVVTVARAVRPDFQFVSGTEYMISAGAIGASGLLSALATVSPRLVRGLYDLCRAENYQDARRLQEDAAISFAFSKTRASLVSRRPFAVWAAIAAGHARRSRHLTMQRHKP